MSSWPKKRADLLGTLQPQHLVPGCGSCRVVLVAPCSTLTVNDHGKRHPQRRAVGLSAESRGAVPKFAAERSRHRVGKLTLDDQPVSNEARLTSVLFCLRQAMTRVPILSITALGGEREVGNWVNGHARIVGSGSAHGRTIFDRQMLALPAFHCSHGMFQSPSPSVPGSVEPTVLTISTMSPRLELS